MIYTGYLSSFAQIDLVSQLIDDFKRPETLVFVDPAMADNGRLYAGFDDAFPQKMPASAPRQTSSFPISRKPHS